MRKIISLLLFLIFLSKIIFGQSFGFNLNEYKNFLSTHQNLSSQKLLSMYNAGKFQKSINTFPTTAKYLDSIDIKLNLTDHEKNLLNKNGFFVTERISEIDMIPMMQKIYKADLPLFISTDAILKAFHQSYDLILKGVEISFLIPKLEELLSSLQNNFHELDIKYSSNSQIMKMLMDADIYLTVARKLLSSNAQTYYSGNLTILNHLLNNIELQGFVEEPLFSETPRKVDYSQFKPRGHYTDGNFPQLARYFKAMMWLGRIELYLIKPVSADLNPPTDEDIQRQITDSYLITELINISNMKQTFDEIEKVITSFVGEQDNVTLDQLNSVINIVDIKNAQDFLNAETTKRFQDTLSTKPFSEQRILSQLLESNPYDPTEIKPASAFLLFGQRFVIDSYVTGNVVFDRIIYNNKKELRMLPSTLDILFALGNSAVAQLLTTELDKYHYSTNLSALRYLIDSYDNNFWNGAIYNLWLNSIRSLNPPNNREIFPQFMQTSAWWQQKMNTQLASWAELRHDNILYAKQSYTGMFVCSFPYGYVEPIPNFYKSMKELANQTIEKFNSLSINLDKQKEYFNSFALVMDTLKTIAEKELDKIPLEEKEAKFLKNTLYETTMCGAFINGWYFTRLIYKDFLLGSSPLKDNIVADYHTSPTDERGLLVGWVKHAGTGPVNLCVVLANLPGVGDVAFAGPVLSYYEYTTTNFLRLTDEEWQQSYLDKSLRPDWVNIYLADKNGNFRGEGAQLVTSVDEKSTGNDQPVNYELSIQNYPNPFNSQTTIVFTVPQSLSNQFTELKIYDINGQVIKNLLSQEIPSGNYLIRWNGKNESNQGVSSGVYFYHLKVGSYFKTGKMNLLK